jgi:hypothetical protein
MLGASDEEHLQKATKGKRVLITEDTDFLRIHAEGFEHAGIVFGKQSKSVGEFIRGVSLIYEVLSADEMRGQLEYI